MEVIVRGSCLHQVFLRQDKQNVSQPQTKIKFFLPPVDKRSFLPFFGHRLLIDFCITAHHRIYRKRLLNRLFGFISQPYS